MAGFASSEQRIRFADLCRVSTRSVLLVLACKSLERCILSSDADNCLDLAPLGALRRLNRLVLLGLPQNLYHLAGLTQLECVKDDVSDVKFYKLERLDII